MSIIWLDKRVKYVGTTRLRELTVEKLSDFPTDELWVVQNSLDEPLVVVVPYALYLTLQKKAGVKRGLDEGGERRDDPAPMPLR
jgi:hypothetical protein